MGYGHLRAARPIARALGVEITQVDRPPLVGPEELKVWDRVRAAYEWTSRASQLPYLGRPFRWALDSVTDIPHLHPYRDLSAPTRGVAALERLVRRDLGKGLVARMRETGRAARHHLLLAGHRRRRGRARATSGASSPTVTSTGSGRPRDAARTGIRYLVPSPRAGRRLRSYGVPEQQHHLHGLPAAPRARGGRELPVLRRNLAARLVRLDPPGTFRRDYREELAHFLGPLPEEEAGRPPTLTFAVGGAGAQAEMAQQFLPGMRRAHRGGEAPARARGRGPRRGGGPLPGGDPSWPASRARWGSGLEILRADSLEEYFERFDAAHGPDRRALDQALRALLLRRARAAARLRHAGRRPRALQPALGARERRRRGRSGTRVPPGSGSPTGWRTARWPGRPGRASSGSPSTASTASSTSWPAPAKGPERLMLAVFSVLYWAFFALTLPPIFVVAVVIFARHRPVRPPPRGAAPLHLRLVLLLRLREPALAGPLPGARSAALARAGGDRGEPPVARRHPRPLRALPSRSSGSPSRRSSASPSSAGTCR